MLEEEGLGLGSWNEEGGAGVWEVSIGSMVNLARLLLHVEPDGCLRHLS